MEINWYWEKTHDVVLDMTDLPSPIEDSSCPPRSNSFLVVLEKSIMLGVSKKTSLIHGFVKDDSAADELFCGFFMN